MRKIRILSGLALTLALIAAPQAGASAVEPTPGAVSYAGFEGKTWGSATLYRSTKENYPVASVSASKAKFYVQRATAGKPWVTVGTYEGIDRRQNVTVPATKGAHISPFNQYFRLVDAATGKALTKTQTVRIYMHPRAQSGTWRYKSTNPVSRYNPCKVITYRLDTRSARGSKSYATQRAHAVMKEMGRWTGVSFKYLGSTSVTSSPDSSFSPSAMITIKYGSSSHGGTAASTSSALHGTRALKLHTKTKIVLSQATNNTRTQAFRDGVLRHEMGHAMGLAHSPTKNDLMYYKLYRYTPSSQDLAGLKAVGKSGGCI